MADELQLRHTATGSTIYSTITDQAGLMWNGSAEVALVVADWSTYGIDAPETPAGSYRYKADFPAGITTPGARTIDFYERIGATREITDPLLASMPILWDGGKEISLAANVDSTATETISIPEALEALLAIAGGKAAVAGGTVTFRKRDGSTASVAVTYDAAGNRTVSTIS